MFKRPHIDPSEYISGERLAELCDEAYWIPAGRRAINPVQLAARDASVIYSHTDQIFGLFDALRTKPGRFIVVTAESDHAVTEQDFQARPWNVVEWFGMNVAAQHPACRVLPLGLANSSCSVTLKPTSLAGLPGDAEKSAWLYVNHRVETNPAIRKAVYKIFQARVGEGWVTVQEPPASGEMGNYPQELARHRFVCCPPGNGIDTHRMWEALYTGTIPVVLRSPVTEAFADLPIVQVSDYAEVTLPFLQQKYEELSRREFAWDKLTLSYWARQFDAARVRARSTSRAGLIWRWVQRKAGRHN